MFIKRKTTIFTLLILPFVYFFLSATAHAHPIDELGKIGSYEQQHQMSINPDKVELTIKMTFYPLDKIVIWESVDKNKDRKLSIEEKTNWMHKGEKSSFLIVNQKKYNFVASNVTIPDYFEFFEPEPASVIINFTTNYKAKIGDRIQYHYEGKDRGLSQIKFKAVGNDGYKITQPKKESDVALGFMVEKGDQSTISEIGVNKGSKVHSFIDTYVKTDNRTLKITLIALLVSFILGALHAATPGHGKALVAGYLIGQRGTIVHALHLGLIITVTHTSSVFLLGIIALFFTQFIAPAELAVWLNKTSGAFVVIFGVILLYRRIQTLANEDNHSHGHNHEHVDLKKLEHVPFKDLVLLGISGGITPCIDALAILLVAISLNQVFFGLIILIAFSMGLASTLVVAGILVVTAKRTLFGTLNNTHQIEHYMSIISAVVIIILGVALILN